MKKDLKRINLHKILRKIFEIYLRHSRVGNEKQRKSLK